MQLTEEQNKVIQSNGDIRVNAVAGSGKTTTIIEYAKTRPKNSRILYLAFNKSVRSEAKQRFAAKGLRNVHVETAHSLAFRYIVRGSNHSIRSNGYKTHEIAEMLGLKGDGQAHGEFIIANHISKFLLYFCNSNASKVQQLNYLDVVFDPKAQEFVSRYYDYIEGQTRQLLAEMNRGKIEMTHDFYLKKFQIKAPALPYDYILFDEGQDASPAMLDVFLRQKAVKVIVGDSHQQIYSWRYAVNSLDKTGFPGYDLSGSFRFGPDIANLAVEFLKWKGLFATAPNVRVKGLGNSEADKVKATIGRTNLGLLLKAIEYVSDHKRNDPIYFEGNINSYTYASDGASLYDVLSLYNGQIHRVRDKMLRKLGSLYELEEYVKKTEDAELGMLAEIVKTYGNEIPSILKNIKDRHLKDDRKHEAGMIFSTVHRSKGMEYDEVHLVDDFINPDKIEKLQNDKSKKINKSQLNEEVNLVYVAATRSRNIVHLPDSLKPENLPDSKHIKIVEPLPDLPREPILLRTFRLDSGTKRKTTSINYESARKENASAYRPWTSEMEKELKGMYDRNVPIRVIAERFERSKGAIRSRLKKLGHY